MKNYREPHHRLADWVNLRLIAEGSSVRLSEVHASDDRIHCPVRWGRLAHNRHDYAD